MVVDYQSALRVTVEFIVQAMFISLMAVNLICRVMLFFAQRILLWIH